VSYSPISISPRDLRRAILVALDENVASPTGRPLTIDSIATDLNCSRSTLQRCLYAANTTYTAQLRVIRAAVAVKAIIGGAAASAAASSVGVSPDHLRQLLSEECGIGPAGLRRCVHIRQRLDSWSRRPAAAGSRLYRRRLHDWPKFRAELHRYLDPIPARSILRLWADQQLSASRRPDFRAGQFRRVAREQREREHAALRSWLDDALQHIRAQHVREQPPISGAPPSFKT